MLELLKFCYQWVLPPGLIILALLVTGIFLLRRRKGGGRVVLIAGLVLWLLSLRGTATLVCAPLESMYTPPAVSDITSLGCDVLVMTGAGSVGGVPDVDGTGQPSSIMAKSMLTAFRLQRLTDLPLLVTGGQVRKSDGREGDIALRIFAGMGVEQDKLLTENQSKNTAQNARFTKRLLQEKGFDRVLLVVPALHAPRAARLFEREGVDCVVYPSNYRRSLGWTPTLPTDLMPTADNLNDVSDALREYLALLAMRLGLY